MSFTLMRLKLLAAEFKGNCAHVVKERVNQRDICVNILNLEVYFNFPNSFNIFADVVYAM